jgi:hypothetical protein
MNFNKIETKRIFTSLFIKCRANNVLRFLDNEGNLLNDFKIIWSVPNKSLFIIAAFQELRLQLKRKSSHK